MNARGRQLLGDLLFVAAAGYTLLVGSPEAAAEQVPPRAPLDAGAYGLLVLAGLAFALQRRAPLVLLGGQTLLAGLYLARGHPIGPILFAVAVAAGLAAVRRDWPVVAPLCGVGALLLVAAALLSGRFSGVVAVGQAGWIVLPAVAGGAVRRSRTAAARAEEEAQRRQVEQERLRLAREVHDLVGHSLSVIALQAGVALHVRQPEQAQFALEAIRRTSAEALEELRATLAIIGHDEARRSPVGGLARLDALVAEVRRCGLSVRVERDGVERHLPAEVDHAAFRVVQESLTNVLRHAGPAEVTVQLLHEPQHLRVVVVDDGAGGAAAPGQGLAGLRERVAALGGHLEAGPTAGRGWRVEAVLPTGGDG